MILGAGKCQVPVIRQAQEMGFFTIAVSMKGDYPGFKTADKACEIDVRDQDEILRVAKAENICGILTDQTDIPVLTAAYIAEQLGLPGIGYDCALRFTNKFQMREYCDSIGVPVPKHFLSKSYEDARDRAEELGFPLVVKPVDSQGSRGVSRVNGRHDLKDKLNSAIGFSACKTAIVEQFLPNRKEVVVQGFAFDFQFTNLTIGDRYYFHLPDMFIPKQTLYPSLLPGDIQQKVLNINEHLIKSFAPKFGNTHSEYLIDPDTGDVHLVETAIRGGGVFISSDLVPLASGINVNELLITCATDSGRVRIDKADIQHRSSGYLCFYLPEGEIRRVSGIEELSSLPGVKKVSLEDIRVGNHISPLKDKTLRLGPILVAGKDRNDLQETIKQVQETLVIEVATPGGIRGIEW